MKKMVINKDSCTDLENRWLIACHIFPKSFILETQEKHSWLEGYHHTCNNTAKKGQRWEFKKKDFKKK